MKVTVQGHHLDVGEALETHIKEKIPYLDSYQFLITYNTKRTFYLDYPLLQCQCVRG